MACFTNSPNPNRGETLKNPTQCLPSEVSIKTKWTRFRGLRFALAHGKWEWGLSDKDCHTPWLVHPILCALHTLT